MRRLAIMAISVLILSGCNGKKFVDQSEPAREVLMDALTAMEQHDYGRYMQHVDLGEEMDTLQVDFVHKALVQYQSRMEATRGRSVDVTIIDADMESDTVCSLFYQVTYADSTSEVASQKMVRTNGDWKIRLRN